MEPELTRAPDLAGSGRLLPAVRTPIAHLSTTTEDLPRVAGAIWGLERTRAFDQIVLDATPDGAGAPPGTSVPVRRIGRGYPPEWLEQALTERPAVALVVHSDDTRSLACALVAARMGAALVRVCRVASSPRRFGVERALERLADVVLVHEDAADSEQAYFVGNPLIDVLNHYKPLAMDRAAWERHGLDPAGYALAVLTGEPVSALAAPLAALASRVPLVVVAGSGWGEHLAGVTLADAPDYVRRISLQCGAGVIVSDSARVHEEAAVLGIPCYAIGVPRGRVRLDAGGTTVGLGSDFAPLAQLELPRRLPMPRAIPFWDGKAASRLADVLVANFARVRLS